MSGPPDARYVTAKEVDQILRSHVHTDERINGKAASAVAEIGHLAAERIMEWAIKLAKHRGSAVVESCDVEHAVKVCWPKDGI